MSQHDLPSWAVGFERYYRVYQPVHRQMIDWLQLQPGDKVLDAGCGGGGFSALLAEGAGTGGSVAALDSEPSLIGMSQDLIRATPFASQITFHVGEIMTLPFSESQFDLIWCSRVIHHLPDQLAGIRELRRFLKPGGRLVLNEGGFPLKMLPFDIGLGKPGIESRFQVLIDDWFLAEVRDGTVPYPYGWIQLLRDGDFDRITAKTFLFEMLPPFTQDQADELVGWLRKTLDRVQDRMLPDDRRTLELLLDPASPHYVLNRSDLHAMQASSLYVGSV